MLYSGSPAGEWQHSTHSEKWTRPVVLLDPGNFSPQYTANLGSSLAACGVDVTLLTSPPLFGSIPEPRGYRVEVCFFKRISAGGMLRRCPPAIRMAAKTLAYPAGLRDAFARLTRHATPGILHVQWAHLPSLDSILTSRLQRRGWQIVVTAHDLFPSQPFWRWLKPHYSKFYQAADAVIVHTARLSPYARELGIPPSRLHVISRGDLGVLKGAELAGAEARSRLETSGAPVFWHDQAE